MNIRHGDIATNRESICGANFQWLGSSPEEDLWTDYDGHGTHVTGTIVGNGYMKPPLAGMAPSVRHIRFAKVLSPIGGTDDVIVPGMDWLGKPTGCEGSDEVLPLIVNMSLSGRGRLFEGRETGTRKLDAIVYDAANSPQADPRPLQPFAMVAVGNRFETPSDFCPGPCGIGVACVPDRKRQRRCADYIRGRYLRRCAGRSTNRKGINACLKEQVPMSASAVGS